MEQNFWQDCSAPLTVRVNSLLARKNVVYKCVIIQQKYTIKHRNLLTTAQRCDINNVELQRITQFDSNIVILYSLRRYTY